MRPSLPDGLVVLPGTDVEGCWERFEVFEALHHLTPICNPMRPHEVDAVVGLLDPGGGDRMIDIACGHGELLIRAAAAAGVEGVGVDLSPWALARAAAAAASRVPGARLSWWLGDAKHLPVEPWDVVTCLGAPWIWNGFAGTARAIAARCRPGAAVAIADLALKPGVGPDALGENAGTMLTRRRQARILADRGFTGLEMLVVAEDGLADYDRRTAESARAWAEQHPGPPAEEHLAVQRSWADDHRRDRQVLDWVVWVGRASG